MFDSNGVTLLVGDSDGQISRPAIPALVLRKSEVSNGRQIAQDIPRKLYFALGESAHGKRNRERRLAIKKATRFISLEETSSLETSSLRRPHP
jgi:hypothetical protein